MMVDASQRAVEAREARILVLRKRLDEMSAELVRRETWGRLRHDHTAVREALDELHMLERKARQEARKPDDGKEAQMTDTSREIAETVRGNVLANLDYWTDEWGKREILSNEVAGMRAIRAMVARMTEDELLAVPPAEER